MTKINRKVQERLRAGLRRFKPLLKAAREREASRADTATLALDLLSDLFGFDRYSEVTSELDNREAVYDFAIRPGGSLAMLIRVSPICAAPDDRYLVATAQHALLHGIEWIVLTNGIGWQVHHVENMGGTMPETPIVLAFDLSHMQPGRDAHLETLFLLTREGHQSAGLDHFRLRLEVTNRHYLGAMMLSDAVVAAVRRELRKLNPGLQITPLEIRENLAKGVLRPDVAASSETAAVVEFLQKLKQDAFEAKRKAADPNRFSSRKSPGKKAKPNIWSAKRGAARKKPVSTTFSQAASDRTLLRISKRADIKKVLQRSESAPDRPSRRGRLLNWGAKP
ncbi:MAG: putative type IV restriction endonuclease [Limisphaerales bacterium]|jgi:predicted type IV restriction endonuclease